MAKINVYIPEPKQEYDESNQRQILESLATLQSQLNFSFQQDLKNEQWVIEPLSNMVIALAIMDTGFKRYSQLDAGEHKDHTKEVLKLCIANQFEECYQCGIDIVKYLYLDEEMNEKLSMINENQILQFWSGLGYYARAKNLLNSAKIISLEDAK